MPNTTYQRLIGNGASTAITVIHQTGSSDGLISIREVSSGRQLGPTEYGVLFTSTNAFVVTFDSAPATNSLSLTYIAVGTPGPESIPDTSDSSSLFVNAMNVANIAFGVIAGESFTVAANSAIGTPGAYMARNIDDLTAARGVAPGGTIGENKVNVWISSAVLTASGIEEGSKLVVRSRRVRVTSVLDEGDNTIMLECEATGVRIP